MNEKIVHIVHCVDTEGPIYETTGAKFKRLENILGVENIEWTEENFSKLCQGKLDLGGKEKQVKEIFSSHLINFNETWSDLETMLSMALSEPFRTKTTDSFGRPYIYNWFCVDHVGYETNPRRRALGYHVIFDYYRDMLRDRKENRDGLHWHFHPMSMYREAHRCGTSFLNSPHIVEVLARRILERNWFPSCCRAGFQTERPDIHWFLEQYIPFDFSNTSTDDTAELEAQADLASGRFGDWRLAPKDWGAYHPSHDNYQIPGNCRRQIARALNVLNRFASISPQEVEKAFWQAREGKPTLLAIASHDFRDLTTEVEYFRQLLVDAHLKFPEVKFKFCEAREAFLAVAYEEVPALPLELEVKLHRESNRKVAVLTIDTVQGEVFGPQPFLAIKTASQRFIHDNLDCSVDLRSWRYVFDVESILPEDLAAVGVGATDRYGNTFVKIVE